MCGGDRWEMDASLAGHGVTADTDAPYGGHATQVRPSDEDLRHLRSAVRLAPQMGEGLGRGALLLRRLPQEQDQNRFMTGIVGVRPRHLGIVVTAC